MMLVPTYVAPSAIEGVGIFAEEPIPAGALIWRLEPNFDRLMSQEQIRAMSSLHQRFIERYGYPFPPEPSLTVVEFDNGRFMNHSDKPNTCFSDPQLGYCIGPVATHEELTCNYAEFEPDFAMLPGRLFVQQGAGSFPSHRA